MVPHGICLARHPSPPLVVLEVAKVNFEHALDPLVQLVHSTLTSLATVMVTLAKFLWVECVSYIGKFGVQGDETAASAHQCLAGDLFLLCH